MNSNNKDRTEIQELMVEVAVLKSRLEAASQEYSHRLDGLNQSHSQIEKERAQYVTRELHDQLYQEMLRRIGECVTKADFVPVENQVRINTQKFGEALAKNEGRNAMIYAMIAALVSIGGLLIGFYNAFIETPK